MWPTSLSSAAVLRWHGSPTRISWPARRSSEPLARKRRSPSGDRRLLCLPGMGGRSEGRVLCKALQPQVVLGARLLGPLGMDDAEAVGAVDRPFHVRLERDLGLVAAARADRGEVHTRSGAARACRTVSAVTRGSPGRTAAWTAFGV